MAERLTYTIEETARLLGISRGSAYQAARAGELPGVVRLGRRLLVPRHALLALLGEITLPIPDADAAPGGDHGGAARHTESARPGGKAGPRSQQLKGSQDDQS